MNIEFGFRTDNKAKDFCTAIVLFMQNKFNVSLNEAVGRMNRLWSTTDEIVGDDIVYHETVEYWAYNIYYGKDSRWWARENDPTLRPLPYP